MSKTSTGTTTNFGDDDDDDEISPELDEARFSAGMIQDAYRNIKNSDKLSSYERRVALREVKEIIQQLAAETDTIISDVLVQKFLDSSESEKTEEQFLVLREEMLRLMKRCDSLEMRIVELCSQVRSLWARLGHEMPRDMLEVKILRKPKSLRPSPSTIAVLLSVVSALEDAVNRGGGVDDDADGTRAQQLFESAKQDFFDVLAACSVDSSEHESIFLDLGCKTLADVKVSHARVVSSVAALQDLHVRANAMPPPPVVDASWRNGTKKENEYIAASHEQWIVDARIVLSQCQAYELLSGIPFHAPSGVVMFLRRCWPPGEQKIAKMLFSDLLQMVLKRMENGPF